MTIKEIPIKTPEANANPNPMYLSASNVAVITASEVLLLIIGGIMCGCFVLFAQHRRPNFVTPTIEFS